MMLGKRARPEMKRTTSMKEFTLDLSCGAEGGRQPLDPRNGSVDLPFLASSSSSSAAKASPRTQRLNPAAMVQTAHFLRVCSLCKRRLVHYRDIYMYRGDSAFCSVECRQQQMTQDERKENCALASKKEAAGSSAAGSQVSATS